MSEICFRSGRRDSGIGSSDEGEEHHEAEEEEDEEQVDAYGADQDYEADHCPVRKMLAKAMSAGQQSNIHCDVVEGLRRVVHGTGCAAFGAECRCDLMHGILVVC